MNVQDIIVLVDPLTGRSKTFEEIEKEVIAAAIIRLRSRSEVARQLRIGRSTLYRKLAKYRIEGGND